jgi:hypothetical protein
MIINYMGYRIEVSLNENSQYHERYEAKITKPVCTINTRYESDAILLAEQFVDTQLKEQEQP